MGPAPQQTQHPPVVLLMGPTASGKTDLALRLAERLPIEIVSVDSAMVYRGLDIGSGKPSPEVLARFPHHLVNILDPLESYSAGQFVRDARAAIDAIRARRRLPLLVGGTMLYFRALRHGLAELPGADPAIRIEIDAEGARRGWPAMHADLARIDPVAATRIQPNDAQRIQRALEVFRVAGRTLTELHASARAPDSALQFAAYAWSPADRQRLHAAIEERLRQMLRAGLVDEVRRLHARGDLHERLPAIRAVGYRQLWQYVCGQCSLEEATQRAIFATRQLARRQLIWLRAEKDVQWIDALDSGASARMEREAELLCDFLATAAPPY